MTVRTLRGKRSDTNKRSKSKMMLRTTSRESVSSENRLLGDLFISDKDDILDLTGNYKLTVFNVSISEDLPGIHKSPCLHFNNTSFLEINNLVLSLGIEDFTIDWWEFVPTHINQNDPQLIFSLDNKKDISPITIINNNGVKSLFITSTGNAWDISDNRYIGGIVYNRWTHWAIGRSGQNFYTYRDGKLKNIWKNDQPLNNSSNNFIIGAKDGDGFDGYIANFRITLNSILWAEEFKTSKSELFY